MALRDHVPSDGRAQPPPDVVRGGSVAVATGPGDVEVVLKVVSVVGCAPGEGTTVRVVTAIVSPGAGLLVRVVALGFTFGVAGGGGFAVVDAVVDGGGVDAGGAAGTDDVDVDVDVDVVDGVTVRGGGAVACVVALVVAGLVLERCLTIVTRGVSAGRAARRWWPSNAVDRSIGVLDVLPAVVLDVRDADALAEPEPEPEPGREPESEPQPATSAAAPAPAPTATAPVSATRSSELARASSIDEAIVEGPQIRGSGRRSAFPGAGRGSDRESQPRPPASCASWKPSGGSVATVAAAAV